MVVIKKVDYTLNKVGSLQVQLTESMGEDSARRNIYLTLYSIGYF